MFSDPAGTPSAETYESGAEEYPFYFEVPDIARDGQNPQQHSLCICTMCIGKTYL
jgi:hypothetical protein